jgi:polygalacturonase
MIRSNYAVLIFASLAVSCAATASQNIPGDSSYTAPDLPVIPTRVFSIGEFGAIGDDKTVNTEPLQRAIDAASKAGGGTVVIPAGVYLCGPLQMASSVCLRLDSGATLRMLPLDQYPGGTLNPADFISGSKLHDVAIAGKGTIDGQGEPWWPYAKTKGAKRPRMIALGTCDRVLVESVHLTDSPMFHIAIGSRSSNVTVRGVIIRAPASDDPVTPSHNTDACNVSGKKVLVENCDISVGDDNFTCGGGTSDVLIRNNTYGNGHGVSIGSPIKGGVSNITVENCTFTGTECGIRIKSDRDRGSIVQDLRYRNLRMTNVRMPILIYGAYAATDREYRDLNKLTPEIAATYPASSVTELTPIYRNISFTNIRATVEKGRRAGLIWGLPEAPVSNMVLRDVEITADRPFGIYFAENVTLENCRIVTPEGLNRLSTTNAQLTLLPAEGR